jgi:hypothetical protein
MPVQGGKALYKVLPSEERPEDHAKDPATEELAAGQLAT